MPRQSKISVPAAESSPLVRDPEKFYCQTCGSGYKRQKSNFPMSQSPIHKANGGYLSTCKNCIDKLYNGYKLKFGDEKQALRRVCMKFDIYWNEEIYNMLNKASTSVSRVTTYIARSNLIKYTGKTFDDTLTEEYFQGMYSDKSEPAEETEPEERGVSDVIRSFWGPGYSDAMYLELNDRYDYWLSKFPSDTEPDIGSEAILRQVCMLEVDINRARAAGKATEKYVSTLNNLLGSANLQPTQKKKQESDSTFIPFGVEIANFENEEPIIEDDPDFKDVDGIRKSITAWFLGHLTKLCNVKNARVEEYEEEMKKYTLERPELEEEDLDTIFGDMGGDVGG